MPGRACLGEDPEEGGTEEDPGEQFTEDRRLPDTLRQVSGDLRGDEDDGEDDQDRPRTIMARGGGGEERK